MNGQDNPPLYTIFDNPVQQFYGITTREQKIPNIEEIKDFYNPGIPLKIYEPLNKVWKA